MDFSKIQRYECLVFDLDGTLVDSMPYHYAAWVQTVSPFGIKLDKEWMYARGGVPSTKIAGILIAEYNLPVKDP